MAGAMVAGLAVGRSPAMVLAAGFMAAVGLKRMGRRNGVRRSHPGGSRTVVCANAPATSPKPKPCCLDSDEKGTPEPAGFEAVPAVAEMPSATHAQPAESTVWEEGIPLVWEQGRDGTLSCGAVETQTVWFGMLEPSHSGPAGLPPDQFRVGAIPALPPLAKASELPASVSGDPPAGKPLALPRVPAIAEGSQTGRPTASPFPLPMGGAGGVPRMVEKPESNVGIARARPAVRIPPRKAAVQGGPPVGARRSVVPYAPVEDRRQGRWVMVVTTLVLVIVVLAVFRGALQLNGWKLPWQVARAAAPERHLKETSARATPSPGRSQGALRSDADGMIR